MGYDLHITRKEYWFDEEGEDITLSEWISYVHSDQELDISDLETIELINDEKAKSLSGYCEWNAHPSKEKWWFDYSNGNIYTKNPDSDTIRKMLSISEKLNARVQGDEGEVYKIMNDEVSHNYVSYIKDKTTDPGQVKTKKPWWKVW